MISIRRRSGFQRVKSWKNSAALWTCDRDLVADVVPCKPNQGLHGTDQERSVLARAGR
jgi:hypothetical protein